MTSTEFNSLVPELPFTRRSFMVTALGAGFALAVQPTLAQSVITTDSNGLEAGEIKVPVKDGEMVAYHARPVSRQGSPAKFPVILVVSEIFGVHEHIADVCRRLAKLGYLAIAPELFARQGDPRKLTNIQEIISTIIAKVPDEQVIGDLDACVAWAGSHNGDPAHLGITGFCWGGRIVWLYAARNPQVKAGVAWYGKLSGDATPNSPRHPLGLAGELKAPVLGLYGGKDQGIPQSDVELMRAAIAKAGGKSELHVYPDAPHAFYADYRPSYRKDVAEDGWQRMQAWFKQNGV